MNKQELVSAVAESAGISKQQANQAIDGCLDAISGSLQNGQEVRLTGFGTFGVTARAATTGRNPRTGAPIKIPASKRPTFRAGKKLKDQVNG